MAITTDITYEVKYNGTTVDEIGQSKTLNLLTSADIEDFLYCGCYNNTMSGNLYPYSTTEGSYDTWNSFNDKYMPFKTDAVTGSYMEMLVGGGSYSDTTENGRYVGVVLVVDTTGEGYVNSITQSNAAKYRIVTEFDARNYYIAHTGNFTQVDGYGATDWEDENAGLYNYDYTGEVLHYVYDDEGTERDINLYGEINIFPYAVFVDDNNLLYLVKISSTILQLAFKAHIATNYNAGYCLLNFTGNNSAENSLSVTYNCLNFGSSFTDAGDSSYNWPYSSTHDVYKYHNTDKEFVGRTHFQFHDFETAYWFTKLEQLLWLFACSGLKFQCNGIMYKPLISDNVVYGYTDDMTKESELDNYTGTTKHDIPVTPPTPPTPPVPVDPWDVDPETYGWSGGEVSGMVKYYLLTSGEMGQLQSAIASNANWTIDYLNCIVSCFVVPNSGIFFDAPIPTTIKFVLDNATQWDTGVSCARIQGTKNKSGGTIEIPRLTNTFYDFEPYSDYSVYIPFCGSVPIKSNVCLGHEIKVTYYPDVPTCSLTAVVSCGGATIAIAKGSFGTMTPVTSNGSDRKTAAVIGDVAPIITGIGTGIAGVALGNPLIVGAGAAQALGGVMGGVKETVQSYAYSVGSTGDSSYRCYYYANYPLIDEVVNDSMFGHSVGYLCNRVGKLSEFKGFTICANPHVTFSASSEEREEIERLLSMGVIL